MATRKTLMMLGAVTIAALGAGVYIRHRAAAPLLQASVKDTGYVNPKLCEACHTKEAEGYRKTGMARALYRPSAERDPEDFSGKARFFHATSRTWYSMQQRDGTLYQRRWQLDFDHHETNVEESKVDYIMGSGNHARSYLHRTKRGALIELPLGWYTEKGGHWAMSPGYDTDHPPTRRKIGYDCMFCHNAYPQIPLSHENAGSEAVFPEHLPEGIDCQRCHGPGSAHVLTAQDAKPNLQTIRSAIQNPARWNGVRQMELCMQCHLETTSRRLPNAIRRFTRGPFSYRPGEPLGDFTIAFDHAPAMGKDNKFEIVSSVYRLRQSQCFIRSNGALTCETCHNPHDIRHGESSVAAYAAVCGKCHATALEALVKAARHTSQTDCISCHMPKRRTEDVVHAVMTDHLITRRPPAGNLLAGIPEHNDTDRDAYRGEVVPYYPSPLDSNGENELYSAVAQVSQKSNLAAGITRLSAAIEKQHPARAEFYTALGDAWRDSGDTGKAIPAYEAALQSNPAAGPLLRRLGIALKTAGQQLRSTQVLQRAVEADPDDAASWFEYGSLESDRGHSLEAVRMLEKAIAVDPDMCEAYITLGAVRAEHGEPVLAEANFRDALRICPYSAPAHANLAQLLAGKLDSAEALFQFEEAIRLAPDDARTHYNYGVTLVLRSRMREAEKQFAAAVGADPNFAEAHDLLGGAMESKGRIPEAEREYRQAIRLKPEYARAHFNLGSLLASQGNRAEALEHLRIAAQSSSEAIRVVAQAAIQEMTASAPRKRSTP